MAYRSSKKRKHGKTTMTRGGHSRVQDSSSGMPQHGFYGRHQMNLGAPNGLFNSRYSSNLRGVEKKFIDTIKGPGGMQKGYGTTGGTVQINLINGISQGTDFNQRVGRTICLKSLMVNWSPAVRGNNNNAVVVTPTAPGGTPTIETVNSNPDEGFKVRCIIFYDRQPNGNPVLLTDLLWTTDARTNIAQRWVPSGGGGGAFTASTDQIDTTAFNNLNNKDRFVILLDKKFGFAQGGPAATYVKKFRKLNLETQFSGPDKTIGSITTGAVWMVTFGDLNNHSDDVALSDLVSTSDAIASQYDVGLWDHWRTRIRYVDV